MYIYWYEVGDVNFVMMWQGGWAGAVLPSGQVKSSKGGVGMGC